MLAFTQPQARAARGLARLAFRFQAYLFFPMLLGEAASLHVASIRALASRASRYRAWESGLLAVHVACYLTAVFLVLPPIKAVVFILGAARPVRAVSGFLVRAQPQGDAHPGRCRPRRLPGSAGAHLLQRARRLLTDAALGGLNYQIEHHLFPSMPRPNLRRSQALIREFCQQRDLPYCQRSLAGSYIQALRHLHSVGKAVRK